MNNYLLIIFFLEIKFIFSKKFVFSVIISIYNTGRYLDDSIGSIINQTIGFNKIQIILVNDGSTDETERICLNYRNKYPENIIYIKINHSGVSIGRNIGIKHAKGKYINFLDADDKWDANAFKLVYLFFHYHKNIDIVGCRMIFFEAMMSYHPLDYKFYKTRKVNLNLEYNCIQLSSSSSFFRHSIIKDNLFDKGIFNGEDTLLINKILLFKPIMGLIKEAIYYYRKRRDSTSAVQNSAKNEDYYFSILKSVDGYLIEKSIQLYNKILPFIQFYIAYNTLFRIILPSNKYLDSRNYKLYCKSIENNIKKIEDKYILEQKILNLKIKLLLLSKKYSHNILDDITLNNQSFIYSFHLLYNLNLNKGIVVWKTLRIKNNILHLEGRDNFFLNINNYFYFCRLGDNIIFPNYFNYPGYDIISMYGNIKGRIIVFDIPIENINNQSLYFYISYKGIEAEIFPSFGWFTHIPNSLNGYYNSGAYIIKIINKRLMIYKYNDKLEKKLERNYSEDLKRINKDNLLKFRNNYFNYRKNYSNNNSSIWIINDRLNFGGDNGEYFFRYLKQKNPKNIKFYFVINSNSSDYRRLKSLGNIIEYGSDLHLNLYLKCEKIFSSVSESWVDNPFNDDYKYIRDLIHFDFIFMPNDIIKDDLSKYINRIDKNYSLIVTSSKKEYNSLLKNYEYSDNNLIITGLPRYDNLQRLKNINKENILLIAPSWRMYIKGTFDFKSNENLYSSIFNSTEFYNFYNNLINNNELLYNMKKYNFIGIFCLHPYFSKQWIDFKQNKNFYIKEICDYQNLILKSSLLVTDYSSIFFDFSYLKKPVIYAHFDYDVYRNNDFPKGYFDYKKDGFGPICFDLNCTITNIILKFQNNCLLERKYIKRITKFFKYNDDNNCERLYSAIINDTNKNNNYIHNNIIIEFLILFLIKFKFKRGK